MQNTALSAQFIYETCHHEFWDIARHKCQWFDPLPIERSINGFTSVGSMGCVYVWVCICVGVFMCMRA